MTERYEYITHTLCALRMIVLLAILLAVPSMASAQEADTVASLSGVEIRTAVDRAEITVGDRISYTLVIVSTKPT